MAFLLTADDAAVTPDHVSANVVGELDASIDLEPESNGVRITVIPLEPNADGDLGVEVEVALSGAEPLTVVSPLYTIDNTPPGIRLGPPSVSDSNNGPVEFLVEYEADTGEAVTIDLDAQDIVLERTGTVSGSAEVELAGPLARRVRLTDLIGDGTVAIRIPAGSARDEAGNDAAGALSAAVIVDNSPISVSIGPPTPATVTAGPVSYSVNYLGVASIELDASDVHLETTGSASATIAVTGEGLSERTIILEPVEGDGTILLSIPEGTGHDANGNATPAANAPRELVIDASPPLISIGRASAQLVSQGPVEYPVTTEAGVTVSLAPSDVILYREGTATADVVVSGGGVSWTVRLENIRGDGELSIGLVAGVATDAAGNASAETPQSEIVTVDNTRPAVTINQHAGQHDPAHQLPITFDVQFSEPVSGFDPEDVLPGGEAKGIAFSVQGEDATYRVFVTGVADPGTVVLSIREGAAVDAAGNPSTASTSDDNEVTYHLVQPPCELTELTIAYPRDGASVTVGPGRYPVGMHFAAETDCDDNTLMVEYRIGALQLGAAFEAPYVVSIDDITATLEPGSYTLHATAIHRESGRQVVEAFSRFELLQGLSAEDPERDGMPNNPADSLAFENDSWISTARQETWSGLRTIAVVRLPESLTTASSQFLGLSDPETPASRVTATVPLGPLQDVAGGLLVMAMAIDPVALFDDAAMDVLGFEPGQGLVPGGRYVYLNYLAPGGTAAGLDVPGENPFAGDPIDVAFEGIPVEAGGFEAAYTHPAMIAPEAFGVDIAPRMGEWDQANLGETRVGDGVLQTELTNFSLVAPFNSPFIRTAILAVRPTTIDFGEVPIYSSAEAEFIVANEGGTLLEGQVVVPEPFEIVDGEAYAIEPGESHVVRVRFTPKDTKQFAVIGHATGAQTRSITMRGEGMPAAGLNCAASGRSADGMLGDLAVLAIVVAAMGRVRSRRVAVPATSGPRRPTH